MERFLLYLQRLMMQIHRFHDGKTKLLILSCNTISYHYWRERERDEREEFSFYHKQHSREDRITQFNIVEVELK
jgi:hypothetical protein